MKFLIRIIAIFSFLFISNSQANSQLYFSDKNSIKLSLLSLISNFKVSYERTLSSRFSLGLTSSVYYTYTRGYKFEPFAKYSFDRTGFSGWYMEGRIAFGAFNREDSYDESQTIYNPNNEIISSTSNQIEESYTFYPSGISILTGYKKFLKNNEKTFIDVNFGLQYFGSTDYPKTEQTTTYDNEGNRIVTSKDYGKGFSGEELYWVFFGAGSIVTANFSIGFVF
jgi:hypothetical protein